MLLVNHYSIKKCIEKIKIATLGPEGTSSQYVTNILCDWANCENSNIQLYDTYEEAFKSVQNGFNDILVVANAYQHINRFYMDRDIELIATFIQNTPKYGIAVRDTFDANNITRYKEVTIVSHPAPIKKLDYYKDNLLNNKQINTKLVDSTSIAAKLVQNKQYDFCLTNEEAVNTYGLKFISKQTDISMVWSIFGKLEILSSFAILNQQKGIKNEMCNFN